MEVNGDQGFQPSKVLNGFKSSITWLLLSTAFLEWSVNDQTMVKYIHLAMQKSSVGGLFLHSKTLDAGQWHEKPSGYVLFNKFNYFQQHKTPQKTLDAHTMVKCFCPLHVT